MTRMADKQYAVDSSGRLIEKHPHAPLKAGWRFATDDDHAAARAVESARAAGEADADADAHDAAAARDHEDGLEQKERDAANAERQAAKSAAKRQTVLAVAEPAPEAVVQQSLASAPVEPPPLEEVSE